jgi:hypothetical protein
LWEEFVADAKKVRSFDVPSAMQVKQQVDEILSLTRHSKTDVNKEILVRESNMFAPMFRKL